MIYTERKVSIKNDIATIDSPIILFRGDREVEIMFTIIDSKFKFDSNKGNVIDKTQAAFGQLAVALPDGTDLFTEVTETQNGVVVFSITGEMIDEIHEVGFYSFHIRLYNDDRTSRITLPPVMNGVEIREPLIIEDDIDTTDVVGNATVGYSMIRESGEEDIPVVDGKLQLTWYNGDVISAKKLNSMVDAINNSEQGDQSSANNIESIITHDMTRDEINTVLSKAGNIRFKAGTYTLDLTVNQTGYIVASNSNIQFDDGVVIEMLATDKPGYEMFLLSNVKNITMKGNATLIGDKDIHTGTSGEWGHGFKIEGCSNICIEGLTIKNCWGDGLYIGETNTAQQNDNIRLINILNDSNRRQGISVISCDGMDILDCVARNIKGINPQSGIDIEPNNTGNIIKNINITNFRSYECAGSGISLSVARIGSGSDVSININNHYDYKSVISLLVFNNAKEQMQGCITINDAYYDMGGINNCISICDTSSLAPKIILNRPRIHMGAEVQNTTASTTKNAIGIIQPYEEGFKIGNVDIIEPYLFGMGRVEGFIYVRNDEDRSLVEKIHVVKPRKDVTSGATSINFQAPVSELNDVYVDLDENDFTLTINYDCGFSNHMQRKYILASNASANRTVNMTNAPIGYECEFENLSPTWKLNVQDGDYLNLAIPNGEYVKLKHIRADKWIIIDSTMNSEPKIIVLTQNEYAALTTKDPDTLYLIKGESI